MYEMINVIHSIKKPVTPCPSVVNLYDMNPRIFILVFFITLRKKEYKAFSSFKNPRSFVTPSSK